MGAAGIFEVEPMNDRRASLSHGLYEALGVLNLLLALVITIGSLFANFGFGAAALLFADIPLGIGVAGNTRLRRIAPLFMTIGCSSIVVYIGVSTYFAIRSGYPMLLFHKAWVTLCFVEIGLSLFRFRQLQQFNGATPWQQ
jgi:hypothetical protein